MLKCVAELWCSCGGTAEPSPSRADWGWCMCRGTIGRRSLSQFQEPHFEVAPVPSWAPQGRDRGGRHKEAAQWCCPSPGPQSWCSREGNLLFLGQGMASSQKTGSGCLIGRAFLSFSQAEQGSGPKLPCARCMGWSREQKKYWRCPVLLLIKWPCVTPGGMKFVNLLSHRRNYGLLECFTKGSSHIKEVSGFS